MMGRQSGQMSMVILDIAELIPNDHLLRKINQPVSFDFIYDLVAPYYPANGRPSVDPVSMFKMLLVGYLYGIKSERRLVQEIQLKILYFSALTLCNSANGGKALIFRHFRHLPFGRVFCISRRIPA